MEDPRAAHQRYKDALKDGSVTAKVMKILIIGAAGVFISIRSTVIPSLKPLPSFANTRYHGL